MTGNTTSHKYEELYKELLLRGDMLHENNKKRIRRGLISLIVLPVMLGFIRWITDSDKVVFLIIWILIMFAVCAYLISIEYLDSSIESTLRDVTDTEAEFDGLITTLDLHERIRSRISEWRSEIRSSGDEDEVVPEILASGDEDEAVPEIPASCAEGETPQDDQLHADELQEAQAAMDQLRNEATPEIIEALRAAIESDGAEAGV